MNAENRIEELTLKLLDGVITPAEEQELDTLIASSPEAAKLHLELVTTQVCAA